MNKYTLGVNSIIFRGEESKDYSVVEHKKLVEDLLLIRVIVHSNNLVEACDKAFPHFKQVIRAKIGDDIDMNQFQLEIAVFQIEDLSDLA